MYIGDQFSRQGIKREIEYLLAPVRQGELISDHKGFRHRSCSFPIGQVVLQRALHLYSLRHYAPGKGGRLLPRYLFGITAARWDHTDCSDRRPPANLTMPPRKHICVRSAEIQRINGAVNAKNTPPHDNNPADIPQTPGNINTTRIFVLPCYSPVRFFF